MSPRQHFVLKWILLSVLMVGATLGLALAILPALIWHELRPMYRRLP